VNTLISASPHDVFERGALVSYVRKIVSLSGAPQPFGYEFLTRVHAPGGRMLTVEEFVSAARREVTPASIDRGIIGVLLESLRTHSEALCARGVTLVLRVGASWLGDEPLIDHVASELQRIGAAPCLIISLDSEALAHVESADRAGVRRLSASGCRFAIAGNIDVAGVNGFPIEFVKIDRRGVRDVLGSRSAERTVLAAIAAARHWGMRTVAPCVDSSAIADRLRTLGVDFGIGSALASAEPLEQLVSAGSLSAHSPRTNIRGPALSR
jgi:EAL domain-containing protein (putative c-di-GMP-specific phosphodiesterase class I)